MLGSPKNRAGTQRRSQVVLLGLVGLGLLALRFPIPFYFGEGIQTYGLVFFISLCLFGPLRTAVVFLGLPLGWFFLIDGDVGFLVLVAHLGFSSLSYILLKRNLLVSELAVWILVGAPGFWISAWAGWLDAPQSLLLSLSSYMSISILFAIVADILHSHGFLQKLMGTHRPDSVCIPVRRILLHATYAPLLAGTFLYLLITGMTNESRILQAAEQTLSKSEQSIRVIVGSWSEEEQREMRLGSMLRRASLEKAFLTMEMNSPGAMVLFDDTGTPLRIVSPAGNITREDVVSTWAQPLRNGLLMLSKTGPERGASRYWQSAIFVKPFILNGQTIGLMIPIQALDAFTEQQTQVLLTLGPFLLLALLLLMFVSRRLEISLNHLADGTTALLQHLTDGQQHEIPRSGIMEVDALGDNFRFMNRTLEDLFVELQSANDDLMAQSAQLRRSESDMFRLAHFDVLTQLPNRHYLRTQIRRFLERQEEKAGRGRVDRRLALLLVDLDKFKPVNDLYGHSMGDLVLQEVGNQFRRVVGDDVESGDFAARLGGDEFVVALFDKSVKEVRDTADAITDALSEPITVAEITVGIASSVGISYWPQDGEELGILLRKADLAMYMAKNRGGNCWAEYETRAETQISLDMIEDAALQTAGEDLEARAGHPEDGGDA